MKRFSNLLFVLCTFGAANATIISVLPTAPSVTVGNTFTVNIQISNVTDLYAWQLDFGYDPLIVSTSSVTNGSFLGAGGAESFFAGNIDNVFGSVSAISSLLTTAVTGVTGSGLLASITFNTLIPGQSSLSAFNLILLDSSFADITATTNSALVTVTSSATVPEPGTATLVLAASVLFALRRIWNSVQ